MHQDYRWTRLVFLWHSATSTKQRGHRKCDMHAVQSCHVHSCHHSISVHFRRPLESRAKRCENISHHNGLHRWPTAHTSHRKQGRPAKKCEDDLNTYLEPARPNPENNDLTNDTTWPIVAEVGKTWDDMEHDFVNSRPNQPAQFALPTSHNWDVKMTAE